MKEGKIVDKEKKEIEGNEAKKLKDWLKCTKKNESHVCEKKERKKERKNNKQTNKQNFYVMKKNIFIIGGR